MRIWVSTKHKGLFANIDDEGNLYFNGLSFHKYNGESSQLFMYEHQDKKYDTRFIIFNREELNPNLREYLYNKFKIVVNNETLICLRKTKEEINVT